MAASRKHLFDKRKSRVRNAIARKAGGRVRLVVFRSNQHIYAQLVNGAEGKTIAQASTLDKEVAKGLKSGCNVEAAKRVGQAIAKAAKDKKVSKVVFDRGGYIFHGKIQALADAAREGGLDF